MDVAVLAPYLEGLFGRPVEVLDVKALGETHDSDVKGFGYGPTSAAAVRVTETTRRFGIARATHCA